LKGILKFIIGECFRIKGCVLKAVDKAGVVGGKGVRETNGKD
jgi:hypothetical protein